jgi:transcriptional regulator NrdR family protein
MNCSRFGAPSSVLDTRPGAHLTTRRRRECYNGHRFMTVEAHVSPYLQPERNMAKFARAMRARWDMWKRDKLIAAQLHLGCQLLAERYALTKTSIYAAARRGRGK